MSNQEVKVKFNQLKFIYGVILALFLWGYSSNANAAEKAILSYNSEKITVPVSQLKAFVINHQPAEEIDLFIKTIPLNEENVKSLLTETTPIKLFASPQDIGREKVGIFRLDEEFVLYQINKLLGDPYGRDNFAPLRQALISAGADNQKFSLLELIEKYPENTIRVNLRQLNRVQNDIDLLFERLDPFLSSQALIQDWLCDGENSLVEPVNDVSAVQFSKRNREPYSPGSFLLSHPDNFDLIKLVSSSNNGEKDKKIIVIYGPLRQSLSINILTKFAQTGELPRAYRNLFKLANINPEKLRKFFNQQLTITPQALRKLLNNVVGEYVLFRAGDLIYPPLQRARIPALRSALILSAVNDNRISPIEVLQNYPTQEIWLNAIALSQFTRTASNLNLNSVENWLIGIRTAIASKVCV